MQPAVISSPSKSTHHRTAEQIQTLDALLPGIHEHVDRLRVLVDELAERSITPADLDTLSQDLHRLFDILTFAELTGPVYVVRQAINALDSCSHPELYTASMSDAIAGMLTMLPAYLSLLADGEPECPALLLMSVNALRLSMNRSPVSAPEIFAATIGADLIERSGPEPCGQNQGDLQAFAKRYRVGAMHATVAVLRGGDTQKPLMALTRVAEKLEAAATTVSITRSWWVLRALFMVMMQSTSLPGESRPLLLRIESLLRGLAVAGESPEVINAHRLVAGQALYLLGRTASLPEGLPGVVMRTYDLPRHVVSPLEQERLQRALGDVSSQALVGVTATIRDDLQMVKESLDVMSRMTHPAVDELKLLLNAVERICSTLVILDRADWLQQMEEVAGRIAKWVASGVVPEEDWANVAHTVLGVEAALSAWSLPVQSVDTDVLQTAERAVLGQVRLDLQRFIDRLESVAESPTETVGEPLQLIGDVLTMTGRADLGACFRRLAVALPAWRPEVLGQKDALAAALEGLRLCLDDGVPTGGAMQARADGLVAQFESSVGLVAASAATMNPAVAESISVSTEDLDVHAVFREEAAEILVQLDPILKHLQANGGDRSTLSEVRRLFHTLKGSGRLAGARAVGELAWASERILNGALERGDAIDHDRAMAIMGAASQIALHLEQPDQILSPDGQHCLDRLTALAAADVAPGKSIPVRPEKLTALQSAVFPADATTEPGQEAGMYGEGDSNARMSPGAALPELETVGPVPAPLSDSEGIDEGDPSASLSELFERETRDYLDRLERYLEGAEPGQGLPIDGDVLRIFHTLKGTAHTVGRTTLAGWAAELDAWVKAAQQVNRPLDPDQVAILRAAATDCRRAAVADGDDLGTEWLPQLIVDRERMHRELSTATADQVDPGLRTLFLEEAVELLAHIDALFVEAASAPGPLPVDALMGDLHTFKGGARMVGAMLLGDLAHAIETYLARLTALECAQGDARTVLRYALDTLQGQLDQWAEGLPVVIPAPLLRTLEGMSVDPESVRAAPESPRCMSPAAVAMPDAPVGTTRSPTAEPDSSEQLPTDPAGYDADRIVSTEAVDEASRLPLPNWWDAPLPGIAEESVAAAEAIRIPAPTIDGLLGQIGEWVAAHGRVEQPVRELASYFREIGRTIDRLQRQLRELEMEAESRIVFKAEQTAAQGSAEHFDPLEFDRYTRLQHLSRMLAESMTDLLSLRELVGELREGAEAALQHQHRVAAAIQQDLLRTRMVAFESQAGRLQRVVRQTAEAVGKQATLRISGGETELDRQVLDRMIAPLEHLLRNALAHGIEPAAERARLGKPTSGQIVLQARREGGQILLEIADDGRGLDTAAILARARQRGLVDADEPLSDTEIHHLILAPGLSTADQVNQIAGRGVGMDVVHAQIKACGGRLEIASEPGRGTRFRIWLPYTMAVSHCLLLKMADERYAVPLAGVDGVLRLGHDQLRRWRSGDIDHLQHLDGSYRLLSLARLLGLPDSHPEVDAPEPAVLLVNSGGRRWALVADVLMGMLELVVRPVGPRVAAVPGISGAAFLSDGGVALMLDLPSLIETRQRIQAPGESVQPPAAQGGARILRILVVDDSITVRRVTARLLERQGMAVTTARDGVDALQKLQEQPPDLVLLDVEMPRMDGFELLANMQSSDALQAIPVVMVTSRTGDKHRERALTLGAAGYLGKPYQEAELLQTIARLTRVTVAAEQPESMAHEI
ncbi:MAG TPA: Hpt domain-containing protein [Candidatus Acidoferrales bacterium]|nr:Hpt domain-containing protein [Candidatus Acidoferrales bacterium]